MPGSGDELAWFMLASHNVSGGAWGKLRKNGSELHIMHYEVRLKTRMQRASHGDILNHILWDVGVFAYHAPLELMTMSMPCGILPVMTSLCMQLAVLCVPSLEAAWRASPLRDFSCTPGFGRQQSAPAWMPSSAQDPVSFKAFHPTWYGAGSPQQQVGHPEDNCRRAMVSAFGFDHRLRYDACCSALCCMRHASMALRTCVDTSAMLPSLAIPVESVSSSASVPGVTMRIAAPGSLCRTCCRQCGTSKQTCRGAPGSTTLAWTLSG